MITAKLPSSASMVTPENRAANSVAPYRHAFPDAPAGLSSREPSSANPGPNRVIPLDEPPLIKLARHLGSEGFLAIAFPDEVRVIVPSQEYPGSVTVHAIKDYASTRTLIQSLGSSTTSFSV